MAKDISVHIISFSIPVPANFGGVIDVFFKLKALKNAGVKIHLHCFQYDRKPNSILNEYCETVNYYKRNTGFKSTLHILPYIVYSRISETLIDNLLKDDYPIIFEGLHSCYYLNDERLKNRVKIYRESNIEHNYYFNLAKSTNNIRKKTFYLLESLKLRLYQKQIRFADHALVVSQKDCQYLKDKFPNKDIIYLPSFHGNSKVVSKEGSGNYVLYHGNLSVEENVVAALYLIDIFKNVDIPFIVAGLSPDESIYRAAKDISNIKIIDSPNEEDMHQLIENAQINILYTAQATGLKLKLLNVLYQGRHVLVNSKIVSGTGIGNLCSIADNKQEMIEKLNYLFNKPFSKEDIFDRENFLTISYNDKTNAKKLISLLG